MKDRYESIRIDEEDESWSRRQRRPRQRGVNRGLKIFLGILLSSATIFIFWTVAMTLFIQSATENLSKTTNQSFVKMQENILENQRRAQERLTNERAEREEARQAQLAQAEQERRLASPECRFWTLQDEQNPSEKTKAKREKFCPVY
ncbi:hypothetical protein [Pseudomonas sp. Q1-7]|uniref:hypothetical protein n=1 Tax=Pseudomonas sp. Q1-7 TaxID=3020843 RepID=UPI0023006AEC|nr:hypothetical protein [Pseudomonas sp. Q1-7]